MAFKGKTILVMGLGLHGGGVGAARFFARAGAKVIVTDLKSRAALKESLQQLRGLNIAYHLGGHREEDFRSTDLIIQNPAVPENSPYLAVARKAGVPVDTDVGVFFELCPTKEIIGVTGTKGKSTTATLVAQMLENLKDFPAPTGRRKVHLAGNIRTSALEVLPKIKPNDVVVLELSSWQLEGLARHKKSPHLAIITSIFPDHLNRYHSMAEYIEAKKLIFKFQNSGDHLFIPKNDPLLKKISREAKSAVHLVAVPPLPAEASAEEGSFGRLPFPLTAPHYRQSVALAKAVAAFYGVGESIQQKVLGGFRGLEGRLEVVAKREGVTFVNDTTATAPGAAIAALKSFPAEKIVLIAGGEDKNLEYGKFVREINRRAKAAVFLPGSATEKMVKNEFRIPATRVSSMAEAVREARRHARRGDIILLSPGAASFNLFKHEFDRGVKFKETTKNFL